MRTPRPVRLGETPTPRALGPVTITDIVRFAGAGGDFNPLHHDQAFAARAGFPTVIAHGQLTAGLLAAWVSDWVGVEHLRSIEVRFVAPVVVGDTVTLSGEVTAVETTGEGLATIAVRATRDGEVVVATGTARARVNPS